MADPTIVLVALNICQPCLAGEGEECHTPGCAFWMHRVDLPIRQYELLEQVDRWEIFEAADGERAIRSQRVYRHVEPTREDTDA